MKIVMDPLSLNSIVFFVRPIFKVTVFLSSSAVNSNPLFDDNFLVTIPAASLFFSYFLSELSSIVTSTIIYFSE